MKRNNKNKIKYEILKREEAFQLYRKLGSIKAIAEIPGMPSVQTLMKWKEEDRWDERIEELKEKYKDWEVIFAKLESDSILRDDVSYLMLLNQLLKKTIKAIVERDLEPTNWKEAMETIKLINEQKRLVLGRATNRTHVELDFASMDEKELKLILHKINDLLSEKQNPVSKEINKKIEEAMKSLPYDEEDKENLLNQLNPDNDNEEEIVKQHSTNKSENKSFLDDFDIDD